MSFSQDPTSKQQPVEIAQGMSVLNPGTYTVSPTQLIPTPQMYNATPPPAAGLPSGCLS